ncbi:MAG: PaaI family thioesterase [Actinobacteria bacterium]|nr:PaaI family thioesterase [Actinomycetota bacterium]
MPPEPPLRVELDQTLDATLGIETLSLSAESATGRIPVEDRIRQPLGLVHGGAIAAIAESLCSAATFMAVSAEGQVAQGLSNQTSFMRPILEGHVNAAARRMHRGRTTWVWEVEITDDDERLCALSRVTMAVRPASDRSGS